MLCIALGYVRNVMTNDHFRFVSSLQNRRWWTYLVALCIMVVFVSIASIEEDMPLTGWFFRRSAFRCFCDIPTFKSFFSSVSQMWMITDSI